MKRKLVARKMMATIMSCVMVAAVASACSSQGTGASTQPAGTAGTGAGEAAKAKAPVDISLMMAFFSKEPPRSDAAIKKIEEYTNSKLNITWVPNNGYPEKLNATIASGSLPKVMVIPDMKASVVVNSVKSGMFWELGPLLKDYPNLSKLNATALKNTAIDGKMYSLPRERVLARNGIIIRKDWLDNLGLKEPKTVDELYNVIKAFAQNDPDKNGKNDTAGITEDKSLNIFSHMLAVMGGGNTWDDKSGSLSPVFASTEYLETMKFMKRLVDEKLMNQDFAINPNRDDDFNKGKIGIAFNPLDSSLSGSYAELRKLNPQAKLTVISRIDGPKGPKVMGGSGFNGGFMIPKTSVKTEAELKDVLTFMDKIMDPKMRELFTWGIEGKHFKKENGAFVFTDKNAYVEEVDPLTQLVFIGYNLLYTEQSQSELGKTIEQMWKENESIAVMNPAIPVISKTQVEKGKELDKVISDAQVKFILGNIDENGWKQAIEQWKKNGGDKVIEETSAEYAKLKK
ncbi:extracellular solute-binding protein [Paenibacillus foliorum]|nr:extracellular solute-binding protein [Paenibacillus foliorum]